MDKHHNTKIGPCFIPIVFQIAALLAASTYPSHLSGSAYGNSSACHLTKTRNILGIVKSKMNRTLLLILVCILGVSANAKPSTSAESDKTLETAGLQMMRLNANLLRSGDNVWQRIRNGFQMLEISSDLVRRHERFYAERPAYFKRMLERSHKYLFHIINEVEQRGMPTEIALLPIIESAFVPTARSSAGAMGLWQFMPATGLDYGLEQNYLYDGRRDVMEATRAALDYLEKLYQQFGDWNLALAGYNWGEGNLSQALARTYTNGETAHFDSIRMPNETRNYVPKLLAVRNILNNPEQFGIEISILPNRPYFVSVSIEQDVDIEVAAKLADISVTEFKALNPAFNLPLYSYKAGRKMLIPASQADTFYTNLAQREAPLSTWKFAALPIVNKHLTDTMLEGSAPLKRFSRKRLTRYVVRRGDTLYTIAQRFKVDQIDLQRWNAMHPKSRLQPGQKVRIQRI